MKIGLITRHAVPNYGSLLQAYSSVNLMEQLGYECKIINYIRYDERKNTLWKSILSTNNNWNSNILKRIIFNFIQKPSYRNMYKKFENYREDLLSGKLTKEFGSIDELKKDKLDFDIYCSGSDQLWGKISCDDFDPTYFLEFVSSDSICCSLSSSFGKDILSLELKNELPTICKKYSFLTVREQSAFDILDELGIKSKVILDPTMLVEKDWNELANKSHMNIKDNYILVYQLHNDKKFDKYLEELSRRKKLKIYRICPSIHHILKKGKSIYLPNIYDFLYLIKNAKLVITDSFHCSVYSILFNKTFGSYLANNTNTRIINLVNQFDLKNKIIKMNDNFAWANDDVNWIKVNKKLKQLKEDSILYLKNNLEVVENEKN